MAGMKKEIQKSQTEVLALLRQYEQERGDVIRLERESLSSFMLKLIGKYEDRLEREQREEINAKLAYDRAGARLESLIQERESLKLRIDNLKADKKRYQAELNNRRADLSRLTGDKADRYATLEKERKAIAIQATEIREAMSAAARAKTTAQSARESLKSAQGWATYDAFTRGGIISHIAKYSHIDNAEQNFSILSSQLRDLKTELRDVNGMNVNDFREISLSQRMVDFWFDNIFTDLSVRGQIKHNIEQLSKLLQGIETAESVLNIKLEDYETELTVNRRAEEELLLSL